MKKAGFAVLFFSFLLIGAVFVPSYSHAIEYSSTNFIVKDPVLGGIGGYTSSFTFGLFSSGDFILTGRTPSSGTFLGHFGFLYFPFVTSPAVSATPGDAQVGLSWSASTSGLGFSVSGYEVGQSTTTGGPYTFVNVGNVTASTRTGLTNGTPYFFVVRTLDAFGTPIITSAQVTATPSGATTTTPGSSGSSGSTAIGIRFIGHAYPDATVTILKNGVLRAKVKANMQAQFAVTVEELFDRTILYTLFADDSDGKRSLLLNYPLVIEQGSSPQITGIRFAPTINADKIAVKASDDITFSGFGLPSATIEFLLEGKNVTKTFTMQTNLTGRYSFTLSSAGLGQADYELRARYPNDTRASTVMRFTVGTANVPVTAISEDIPGDCNVDKVIDLRDFSVLAFWYGRPNPPTCIDTNHDGVINVVDFSILAYYWTG